MSTEQQKVFLKTVDNGKFITNSGNLREYDEQNPYHVRDVAIVSLFSFLCEVPLNILFIMGYVAIPDAKINMMIMLTIFL